MTRLRDFPIPVRAVQSRSAVSPAPFIVSPAALVLATACECSSNSLANAYAHDDGGQDAKPRVEASIGSGGSARGGAPVDTGAGGNTHDGRTDGSGGTFTGGSIDADAAPDAPAVPDASRDGAEPISLRCGDAIRGPDEECDDGNQDETDFCTRTCRVHDRLALAADNVPFPSFKRRSISRGYHVVAGNRNAAAVVFADESTSPRELRVALFRTDGTRIGGDGGINVSEDRIPIDETDGVVAALPGSSFAVAWTVFPTGAGHRSVAMRTVDGATGALGAIQTVSSSSSGSQEAPDLVWTGSEVVVSWMDRTDPLRSQGRIRRFDAALNPMGAAEELSSDGAEESIPTLAAFGGTHAALWVEKTPTFEFDVHVRSRDVAWSVSGIPRFVGDRLRLEALDSERLIAAWTQVDYLTDGGYNVARLYAAVFDKSAPGETTPIRITGLSAALGDDPTRGYREPALAVGGTSAFIAWVSEPGVLGSVEGALVVKEMPWRPGSGGLDVALAEEPLARNPLMQNTALENAPALASIPWTTGGTLFAAWEDGRRVFGREERSPDVIAQLLPVPITRLGATDGGSDAQ